MGKISVNGGASSATPVPRTWTAALLEHRPVGHSGDLPPSALDTTPQVGDVISSDNVPVGCTIF